ncbi:MAG: MFS transporter [Firmicutes bacterium]|nr:MFS transporter [Bacillota bacterium]
MAVNRRVLSVYLLGVFIGALDANVLGPAFPLIARGFHISLTWTAWTVTAYTVAYVAATVWAGALGDRLGHRRVFLWGIGAFGVASALAMTARSLPLFLLARVIQGAGAGAVYPNAQVEGIRLFPAERQGLALGLFGAVFGIASMVGPLAGGALAQQWGWPAIFAINLPIALLVLVLGRRLPISAPETRPVPDWMGGAGFAGFLAAALLGFTVGGTPALVLWVAALALLGLFLLRQRQAARPFLDTAPLQRGPGAALMAGSALIGFDMAAAVFVPTLVQQDLGFSVLASGFALLPAAFTGAVFAGVGGVLTDRVGPRAVLTAGLAMAAAGGLLLAWPHLDLLRFVAAMVFLGIGTAFTMGAPTNRMGLALYRADQAGEALALMAVFRSAGLAAGPVFLALARHWQGFTGMFGAVTLASLLGMGLFLLVPPVRPSWGERAGRMIPESQTD